MVDHPPQTHDPLEEGQPAPDMFPILRREYVAGMSRETARQHWGRLFDDKLWDQAEELGRSDLTWPWLCPEAHYDDFRTHARDPDGQAQPPATWAPHVQQRLESHFANRKPSGPDADPVARDIRCGPTPDAREPNAGLAAAGTIKGASMNDETQQPNKLALYRREFLGGWTREDAKARWGEAFDEKAWDYVEKIGLADPEEECARPHPRDILKWEHDHPHPRNEALEKWGASIEAMIERDWARGGRKAGKAHGLRELSLSPDVAQPDGPDLDRE